MGPRIKAPNQPQGPKKKRGRFRGKRWIMSEYTTIAVSRKLHDWLVEQGKKNESFDRLLKRLLGVHEVD